MMRAGEADLPLPVLVDALGDPAPARVRRGSSARSRCPTRWPRGPRGTRHAPRRSTASTPRRVPIGRRRAGPRRAGTARAPPRALSGAVTGEVTCASGERSSQVRFTSGSISCWGPSPLRLGPSVVARPGELDRAKSVTPVETWGLGLLLPSDDTSSTVIAQRSWSRHSPATLRKRGEKPSRRNPAELIRAIDASLSGWTFASTRCSPSRPNACVSSRSKPSRISPRRACGSNA